MDAINLLWARSLVITAGTAAVLLASTGCATMVPLTQELRAEHDLGAEELQSLQYYVSHDVVLRREVESGGRQVSDHRLLLRSGKVVEEVVIPAGTPGVATEVGEDFLRVSFQPGTNIEFAIEGASPHSQPVVIQKSGAEPNPFPGESEGGEEPFRFGASSLRAGGNYWVTPIDGAGSVEFGGKIYEGVEETLRAHLLIDSESLEEVVEQSTTLGGRTL